MSAMPPLLELIDVARYFDVSPPWLNRCRTQAAAVLHAVDGVSFDDRARARRWRWSANRAAASRRWRG